MSTQPNGLMKVTIYLDPKHYFFLKSIGLDKVKARGGGKPDMSEDVRAVLDAVMEEFEQASTKRTTKSKPKKR
jgi:hypothetical protein